MVVDVSPAASTMMAPALLRPEWPRLPAPVPPPPGVRSAPYASSHDAACSSSLYLESSFRGKKCLVTFELRRCEERSSPRDGRRRRRLTPKPPQIELHRQESTQRRLRPRLLPLRHRPRPSRRRRFRPRRPYPLRRRGLQGRHRCRRRSIRRASPRPPALSRPS